MAPPALALGLDPADDGDHGAAAASAGEGVLTPQMWRGIVFVGVVMAVGTLFVLDASLPAGSSPAPAIYPMRRRWPSRR